VKTLIRSDVHSDVAFADVIAEKLSVIRNNQSPLGQKKVYEAVECRGDENEVSE
jgi:hypothetical protein